MHYAKLKKYAEVKAELTRLKKLEMDLRIEIVEEFAKDNPPGTYPFTSGKANIKIAKKLTYKFDKDKFDETWHKMTEAEQEAVKWTPSLVLTKYKELNNPELLTSCLYTKDAAPTVTVTFSEE